MKRQTQAEMETGNMETETGKDIKRQTHAQSGTCRDGDRDRQRQRSADTGTCRDGDRYWQILGHA